MTAVRQGLSKVDEYLQFSPATGEAVRAVLKGGLHNVTGDELVDAHLAPMMDWVYGRIADEVRPDTLTPAQALVYINELSVFARYNAHFLHRAATSVEGECFELAHEFRRNCLEEGGERGKVPAHYVLYSAALLDDLGVMVNGHVPAPETTTLLVLHDLLVSAPSASTICGGYYATEGVAINETLLLRAITDRYAVQTVGRAGADLPALDYYYSLHLDADHEAATGGMSVEAGHIEGIAGFIRRHDLFHLELPRICDGFLQILKGMEHWWSLLAVRAGRVDS